MSSYLSLTGIDSKFAGGIEENWIPRVKDAATAQHLGLTLAGVVTALGCGVPNLERVIELLTTAAAPKADSIIG